MATKASSQSQYVKTEHINVSIAVALMEVQVQDEQFTRSSRVYEQALAEILIGQCQGQSNSDLRIQKFE